MFELPISYTTLGVLLSIFGNLLISISLNIQKSAHLDLESSNQTVHKYYTNIKWQIGFILMSLGEVGNFVSYGLAPVSLVAPLGVVTIISNSTFVAPVLFHEPIGVMCLFGTFLCAFGVVLMISCSMNSSQTMDPIDDPFDYVDGVVWSTSTLVYVVVTVCLGTFLIASMAFLNQKHKKRTIKYVLSNLTIVALFGAYTATSTKLLSSIVEFAPFHKIMTNYRSYTLLLIIIVTSVLQIKYLNKCLRIANASTVVPIHFVFFTTSVLVCSVVVFHDFSKRTPIEGFIFILGAFLTFTGVFFICGIRGSDTSDVRTRIDNTASPKPNQSQSQCQFTDQTDFNMNGNTNSISIPPIILPDSLGSLESLGSDCDVIEQPTPLLAPPVQFNQKQQQSQLLQPPMRYLIQSSKSTPELPRLKSSLRSPSASPTGRRQWPVSMFAPLLSLSTSSESANGNGIGNEELQMSGNNYGTVTQAQTQTQGHDAPQDTTLTTTDYHSISSLSPSKFLSFSSPILGRTANPSNQRNTTNFYEELRGTKRRLSLGEYLPHHSQPGTGMGTPSFDLESLRSGLFRSTSSNNNLAGSASAASGAVANGGSGKAALGHGYFVLNSGGLMNSMIEVPNDDEDERSEEYECGYDGSERGGCGCQDGDGDLEQLKAQRSLKRPLQTVDETTIGNGVGDGVSAMTVDDIV
ncbi:unnamed protein product [Ambrosiozyma monospora]|uniref:Unnamed protein product n=1 Tax=Ambrosiozyma monospora TaxID=43982 RepID=A0A9W7DEQ2_AMBMO|nr:unnamed protein product [Ambrosiozyma monospora]